MSGPTAPDSKAIHRPVRRHGDGDRPTDDQAVVVAEEPLEIRLSGTPLAVVMRTPGDDVDLITGFALTEGILLAPGELRDVTELGDGRWEIGLADGVDVDPEQFRRNLYATSSCGVCGKASIDAVRIAAAAPEPLGRVDPDVLRGLPETMFSRQEVFHATGGLHAAGLFAVDGTLEVVREDIGRHNAVDKVVGAAARRSWRLPGRILLVSGRVSFEIVQKAAVAGIPAVAGISAPSSLAIDLADELGMLLVAFLRGSTFNVYAGADRIGS